MNRLQQYLSAIGLPWRDSRADLAARFDIRRCAWSLDEVVELGLVPPPPFPGLIRPLQFRLEPSRCQEVPPLHFSGYADPHRDAMRNLHAVTDAAAAVLGPGEYDDTSVNARSFAWQCGPTRLQLYAFPPKLQDRRTRNRWHEREPRLRQACSISIESGYRPPLLPQESGWVDSFVPGVALHDGRVPRIATRQTPRPTPRRPGWLDRLFGASARPGPTLPQPAWTNPIQALVGNSRANELGLEYTREPPPSIDRVFGALGASPGGEALIWCYDQLRIVPRAHVRALRLDRCEPERGGAGEALLVLCCDRPGEAGHVELPLARRYGLDSLDELAPPVAAWLEMPLEVQDVW